jgi:hypothetical protein
MKDLCMGVLRRHRGLRGARYRKREKLLAIGDDFRIETEEHVDGLPVRPKVDAKAGWLMDRDRLPGRRALR